MNSGLLLGNNEAANRKLYKNTQVIISEFLKYLDVFYR